MKIGFTGTHLSLSKAQRRTLYETLATYASLIPVLHHSNQPGGDQEAHYLASTLGYQIAIHPVNGQPTIMGAGLIAQSNLIVYRPNDPRTCQRHIVQGADLLVACPFKMVVDRWSQPWWTVHHAAKKKVPTLVIFPDGTTHSPTKEQL